MKKIKTLLIGMAGLAAGMAGHARAEGKVTIHYAGTTGAGQTAVVDEARDLNQLLASPALANRFWAPGSVIADPAATATAQQHYQQTLAQLRAWAASEEGERAATINQVIAQLTALRVTGRLFTSLDPDWVRNHPAANRTLVGDYTLYTATSPDSVRLMGAISGAGFTPWQPGRTIRDYLDGHDFLSGADLNEAMVIDPDGVVRVAPVAYWNHRHVEAQPGSIIWVGFSSWALPRAWRSLNQQIVSVLTHRIPD